VETNIEKLASIADSNLISHFGNNTVGSSDAKLSWHRSCIGPTLVTLACFIGTIHVEPYAPLQLTFCLSHDLR